jgi:hypothetical protein
MVLVLDQQPNRRSSGLTFEYARKDFDAIGFATLARVSRRASSTPLYIALNILVADSHARWTTINDCSKRRPMTFAKGRDGEEFSERVS